MREWVCIILINYPFKLFVEKTEELTSIISGTYSSKYITFVNIITETIIGRDLYLTKWNEDYCDFQGLININVNHIMVTSPIKNNSEFSLELEKVANSKNEKIKIKQL